LQFAHTPTITLPQLRLLLEAQLGGNEVVERLDLVGAAEPGRHFDFDLMALLPRPGAEGRRDLGVPTGVPSS